MRLANIFQLGVVLAATTFAAGTVRADYPEQPIRLVVPFSPGGGNDIAGRLLAKHLAPLLGASIVVENRPGAGGNVGLRSVAHSKPDGYTIGYISNGVVMNPYLYKEVGFDIQKDFDPVAAHLQMPIWIVARPQLGITSLKDLLVQAKARPGVLTYATPGIGTPHHMGMELLQSMADVKFTHIPYKGASGALTDTLGGQVDFLIATPASVASQVKAGQLIGLATMDATPDPDMPNLPPVADTVPGFSNATWHGLVVPNGTDPARIEKVAKALESALATPELQNEMKAAGFNPFFEGPDALRTRIAKELEVWRDVTRRAGIQPE